ncbi:PIN domain-containing protein [Vibrio sp. NH-7]
MENLFIDTNVYLSFYHLSNDDLEEIHKLAVLIKTKKIKLWVTQQVKDEFYRNREVKIQDAIKKLKDHKIKGAFPQFCKEYDEYEQLKELQNTYGKLHSKLLKSITEDALERKFNADEKIKELFKLSKFVETSDDILSDAKLRLSVGNPPGKNGSLGDAINWEAILYEIPKDEDLHFVADDKDYYSVLDENRPKDFLLSEWNDYKRSDIFFYRRLSQFFKEHYPEIKLASELEKEIEIKNLSQSGNFSRTHTVISKLTKFEGFSQTQVNQLIEIAIENDQVRWIFGDDDVYEFYTELVDRNIESIDEDSLEKIQELIARYAD